MHILIADAEVAYLELQALPFVRKRLAQGEPAVPLVGALPCALVFISFLLYWDAFAYQS